MDAQRLLTQAYEMDYGLIDYEKLRANEALNGPNAANPLVEHSVLETEALVPYSRFTALLSHFDDLEIGQVLNIGFNVFLEYDRAKVEEVIAYCLSRKQKRIKELEEEEKRIKEQIDKQAAGHKP